MADPAGSPLNRPRSQVAGPLDPAGEVEFQVEYNGNVYSVQQSQMNMLSLEIPGHLSVRVSGEAVVLPVVGGGAPSLRDRVTSLEAGSVKAVDGEAPAAAPEKLTIGTPKEVARRTVAAIKGLPIDSRHEVIDAKLDALDRNIEVIEKVVEVGAELEALSDLVEDYQMGMKVKDAERYKVAKAWSYITTWSETPSQVLGKKLDLVRAKYTKGGWDQIQSLYMQAAMNPNMSKAQHDDLKAQITEIISALDSADCIEGDPRCGAMMTSIEQEFGVLGLTKLSRDRIQAAAPELQGRIDATNGLIHYIFNHSTVLEAGLDRGFLRLSGLKEKIDAGVAAFKEGGTAALQEKAEELEFGRQDFMGVLKRICAQNFEGIMFLSEVTHPELIFKILSVVAGEDTSAVSLKSVYQGFPLARPCFKEVEHELSAIQRQMRADHDSVQEYANQELATAEVSVAEAQSKLDRATTPKSKRFAKAELEDAQERADSARALISDYTPISEGHLIQAIFFPRRYNFEGELDSLVPPVALTEALHTHGSKIKRVIAANPRTQLRT